MKFLRSRPILFCSLLLIYSTLSLGYWIVHFQPAYGIPFSPYERIYLAIIIVIWWLLVGYCLRRNDLREFATKLAASSFTKPLLAITSILMALFFIEMGMRVFFVQSDSFSFTRMHHLWLERYWHPINSLDYRDNEPNTNPDVKQILIVGDSFVAGHGTNHIEDTFPHVLNDLLGDEYTVNIVAQPGWDSNVQLSALENYPVKPDIVILSHYFNDIGYTLNENPVKVTPPQPPVKWFVDEFFLPNFLYWNVFQLGIDGGNYTELLLAAYETPNQWGWHTTTLAGFIEWSNTHQTQLIVIVWSPLTDLDQGKQPVVDYFRGFGIPVVDMGEALEGKKPEELVVNPFDTHPNVETHHRAAELLYETIVAQNP